MSIVAALQSDWFSRSAGQYILAKEQAMYDKAVFDLFGFNALQMGCLHIDLLRNSRIPHRYYATEAFAPLLAETVCAPHLSCCDDFLPFADLTLDLLLLPHRLEFSERPHQTLREAARVIMPEGHLLISGFNPLSAWGVAAMLNQWLSKNQVYPWNGEFIGLARLKDWLALLGFEVISVEKCCHVPPFEQTLWRKRCAWMDKIGARFLPSLGGIYFIVAKKRVVGMTPLKPVWKTTRLKSALGVKQPESNTAQSKLTQKIR